MPDENVYEKEISSCIFEEERSIESFRFINRDVDDNYLQEQLNESKRFLNLEIISPSRSKNFKNHSKDSSILKKNDSFNIENTILRHCDKPKNKTEYIKELKKISSWNLPSTIAREYYIKGITEMFDWQVKCLNKRKILLENGNLIYSAPTSAGKTLVSEILMIKTIIERHKKALLILPFISVVREKMLYLQDILTSSGYRVEGYFGGYSPPGGFETIHLAICTIEKANSIVNKLIAEGKLNEIGIIVVDEIHLLTDPSRGYILELLLTKIIYMSKKFEINIQIVGMSATLTNITILKNWLNADLYVTNYRPVQLNEMIKVGNKIYDHAMKFVRELRVNYDIVIENDQDHIAYLCVETILDMCSVLIFCPSKDWCETLSIHIARSIYDLSKKSTEIGTKLKKMTENKEITELQADLENFPCGLDTVLKKTIKYGCAFHHAGLTMEERDIIERCFKKGILKVIIATSTLSSGVNLPARRVIIRSPLFGGKQMDSLTYRQMIGRAGRTGIDIVGESILICNENNLPFGKNLIGSTTYNISSCLGLENSMALKRAILEVISAGVAQTKIDLQIFLKCTLFETEQTFLLQSDVNINDTLNTCLDFLIEYEFIRFQYNNKLNEQNYIPTRLGMACLASSLPTTDALILLSELQKSRRCFVLESDLHAVYLVTPYSVCYQIRNLDWLLYIELWENLPVNLKKVGELIGVKESVLVQSMRGHNKLDYKALQIHKRFYIALALNDLVNEVPLGDVAKKYNCNRGLLQSLQQTAATFAGIVNAFCKSLNWDSLALIISQFKERLYFGVHQDLVDLIKLPDLNSQRARALYNSGIETLMILANSDNCTVENILHNCVEFESGKKYDDEDEFETNKRKDIRNVHITGSRTLTIKEAAEKFIFDARKYLELEIGAKNIEWCKAELQDDLCSKIQSMEIKENYPKDRSNIANIDSFNILHSPIITTKDKEHTTVVMNSRNINEKKKVNEIENISDYRNILQLERHDNAVTDIRVTTVVKERRDVTLLNINSSQHWNSIHILSTNKNEIKPISFNCVLVIDICGDINLFQNALVEILQERTLGFSVATQKIPELKQNIIGTNLFQNNHVKQNSNKKLFDFIFDEVYVISGISISLGSNVSYFLNMQNSNISQSISQKMKLKALRDIVGNKQTTLRIQNAKKQLKIFLKAIPNIYVKAKLEDPKTANWLLQPDQISSLREMTKLYAPECYSLVNLVAYEESHPPELDSYKAARIRSSAESCISYHVLCNQVENLSRIGHLNTFFYEIEMPIQKSLMVMECFGFAINSAATTRLAQDIREIMKKIEIRAYELHGSHFNLCCTSSVAKVLGIQQKSNGRYCTSKVILEKLNSAISNLILSYRKLSTTLSKTLIPLLKNIQNNRIHSNSYTFTTTGRMSMAEPNLQNIPKDYEITIPEIRVISCRNLFITSKGKYLVSADFRQVEIRILAHLSQDIVLKEAIQSRTDVFTSIAAQWNNISEENISLELRNRTKQICYGIIYGMGVKTLSESLNCTEQQASYMCEQFHMAYPRIRVYLNKIIKFARENGYIETVTGRRRYLNNINNNNLCLKSQAERQAINSTIQGSAADIMKSAILRMEKNLIKYSRMLGINDQEQESKVNLVHHIHDELIYEVTENNINNVAKILKSTMENCAKLSIPLKVKIKVGESWGNMNEI